MAVVDEEILSNLNLSNWNQETKETAQVVLAVDEIEDLPGSARLPADKAAERKYPGKSSTVKIAELLELVKGDAEKCIPKQEIVRDIQINVQSMLGNLPQNATVHVQNENELAAVGATDNLRGLAANVKFISGGSGTNQSAEVNQKHSRELTTDGRVVAVVDEDILKKEESSPTVTTNKSPDGIFEDSPKDNVAQQEQNVKLKSSRGMDAEEGQQRTPLGCGAVD